MNLTYQSTRGGESGLTASQAILKGLADDGGLFMPTSIPKLDVTMEELAGMTYQETAYRVMKQFLTDFTEEELRYCIDQDVYKRQIHSRFGVQRKNSVYTATRAEAHWNGPFA